MSNKMGQNKTLEYLAASVVSVVIAGLVAWAISDGAASAGGFKVAVLCAIWAFVLNWIVFVPSWLAKTEHFFDLTGAITYLTVAFLALTLSDNVDARSILIVVLVTIWASRLGLFLFNRVKRDLKDRRFDKLKQNWGAFLRTWSLQGLWVVMTLAAGVAAITSGSKESIGVFAIVGTLVWLIGFGIEVAADTQKSAFKKDSANDGRFISTGVWAWSRHPNYFGEITLWLGIFIIAIPALQGWQWVAIVSPVFVYLLLTRISGVPLLERRADKTWGGQADYEAYKAATPELMMRPPTR